MQHVIKGIENFEYFIFVSKRNRPLSLIIPWKISSFPTVCNTLRRNDSTRYRSFIKLYVTVEYTRWPRWEIFSSRLAALFTIDDGDDRGILCAFGSASSNRPVATFHGKFFEFFYPQKGSKKPVQPTICSAIFSFIKPSIFELTGLRHPIRLFPSARSWAITFNRR